MADPDFTIRQGDTLPTIRATLTTTTGAVVDLSSAASVIFKMARRPGVTPKINAAAAVIGLPTAGTVEYTFLTADTDAPGRYVGEWQVTFSSGAIETFPNCTYSIIRVAAQVA